MVHILQVNGKIAYPLQNVAYISYEKLDICPKNCVSAKLDWTQDSDKNHPITGILTVTDNLDMLELIWCTMLKYLIHSLAPPLTLYGYVSLKFPIIYSI